MRPARTANSSGVKPDGSRAWKSAPASIRSCDDGGVAFRGGPHQRGLPAPLVLAVHARAVGEQRLHGRGGAGARGRSSTASRRRAAARSDPRRPSGAARSSRRCRSCTRATAASRHSDSPPSTLAPARTSSVRDLDVVVVGGPVQRRHAVGCGVFTSACWSSSARSCARSRRSAASASGARTPAAVEWARAGSPPSSSPRTQASNPDAQPRASAASEARERSAPAKRRARERDGESEGRSPSDTKAPGVHRPCPGCRRRCPCGRRRVRAASGGDWRAAWAPRT